MLTWVTYEMNKIYKKIVIKQQKLYLRSRSSIENIDLFCAFTRADAYMWNIENKMKYLFFGDSRDPPFFFLYAQIPYIPNLSKKI